MASSHSDSSWMEQIITEFFAESLQIILESRTSCISSRNFTGGQTVSCPSSSSSSSSTVRPRDKSFNLALTACPEVLEYLDLWCQSNLEPLFLDVVLVKRAINRDPANFYPKMEPFKNLSSKELHTNCWISDQEEPGNERSEKIIERWIVQYRVRKAKDAGKGSKISSSDILSSIDKLKLLLRSLYLTVRLLPAYKIFRENLTGQIRSFALAHRVSSFVEPFTRREEAEMQRFGFAPVDTSSGRLCLSVLYRSSLSDVSSEPSTPMSPQLIPDYVGSPLADPLRRFSSLPVSHGSPSSLPFKNQNLPPSLPLRGTRYGPSAADKSMCPSHDGATVDKMSFVGRDDIGRPSGLKLSSGSSAHISCSRSSCRSFHDDFDESECTCPFHVGKDGVMDPGSRADLFDKRRDAHYPPQSGSFFPIRKSPSADVRALVDILEKAPPLHQDLSNMATASQASRSETWSNSFHEHCQTPKPISAQDGTSSIGSSALLTSKTTADALEELEVYKEMKNFLPSQRGTGR